MSTPVSRKRSHATDVWSAYAKAKVALAKLEITARPPARDVKAIEAARQQVDTIRNGLVEQHLQLVRNVAERISSRVPRGVELEDLLSEGLFGLMHAVDSYDPARGTRFETFAPQRIRGAILDYLRSLDWTPRLSRMRQRAVDHATNGFYTKHGRMPTDSELVALLPGQRHEAQRVLDDGRLVQMGSLETRQALMTRDDEYRSAAEIADPHADSPLQLSHRRMLQDYVGRELSRSERLIIVLNYYEDLHT